MVRQSMMVLRTLIISLILYFGYVLGQEVVRLEQNIHGTLMTTRKGRAISAYLGIPYAEPPIGQLRFKSPIEYEPRNGPIKADAHPNQCPQLNDDGVVVGDEDCLYLNVYTPEASPKIPYPVMVYFHGGNFVRGSSKEAGPEYLLDEDIVLVTVNYRLGVLGFLSTGDAAAPGNFGLKDQALALKWVREYILAFGGHYHKVTIFGQDAGGVSTILLAVSPTSRGLFDQYISQSGTPLAIWAFADEYTDQYSQYSRLLGKYVQCPEGPSIALVECLRSVDPSTLVNSDDIFNNGIWRYRTWAPTTEHTDLPGKFLTYAPAVLALMSENWIKDCPAIIGYVSDEGLLLTADFYTNDTLYNTINEDVDGFLIPLVDNIANNGHPEESEKKVKQFYSNLDSTDKDTFIQTITKIITDTGFTFPNAVQFWLMDEIKSPYYMYKFNYRGSYSKTSEIMGTDDSVGVTHGDDLTYLFPQKNATTKLSKSDETMIDIMVDFWTSFASGGTPTSQYISDPNMWKAFHILEEEQEKGLEIGKGSDPSTMSLIAPLKDEQFLFWNEIIFGELFKSLAERNLSV